MKIHEYQAKEIFKKHGIPIPDGKMAETVEDALEVADELGGEKFVVKAQVHAGGRGKGGGVKLVDGKAELFEASKNILGMKLVTHQTGPQGIDVKKIYIERQSQIERSLYMAIVTDRSIGRVVMTASSAGDVEIEKTAEENPELIIKEVIDPAVGMQAFQGRRVAQKIGLTGDTAKQAAKIAVTLYRIYEQYDCSLAEINPLAVTPDGNVIALDAKIDFDDNALYRHKELLELDDPNESEAVEAEAGEHGLSYVKLEGNIGCLVNGAGLAMATMDIVALAGGFPANFLDMGGTANKERVSTAFGIILRDKNVKAIFVNVFGGIIRCPMVAEGVMAATRDLDLDVPIVVCLKGTEQEEGRRMLDESGLNITSAETMAEGAKLAVELAGGGAE